VATWQWTEHNFSAETLKPATLASLLSHRHTPSYTPASRRRMSLKKATQGYLAWTACLRVDRSFSAKESDADVPLQKCQKPALEHFHDMR
jgi:hypothetical protein